MHSSATRMKMKQGRAAAVTQRAMWLLSRPTVRLRKVTMRGPFTCLRLASSWANIQTSIPSTCPTIDPTTPLVGLPRYRHADWVNVSRQKFNGLVGHDLIWCLYCDWMTGVYSLGAEMLRNVESFWGPIRFASGKKWDNCNLDFPDIEGGWIAPEGTMGDVGATLERMYGAAATADLPRDQRHPWLGHAVRATAGGKAA